MDELRYSPFKGLGKELRKRRRQIIFSGVSEAEKNEGRGDAISLGKDKNRDSDEDLRLFLEAMEGVIPLRPREEQVGEADEIPHPDGCRNNPLKIHPEEDHEAALRCLQELVSGAGLISLKDTSEFVSGGKSPFSSIVSEALHEGRYSVQAYLDMHGMDIDSALHACHDFLMDAIRCGLRCVAFIHGRGLGSKKGPVLKKALVDWLERGPFRRRLVAYSSAPPWDGGTGVTYCLLKGSPYKRKRMKKRYLRRHGG